MGRGVNRPCEDEGSVEGAGYLLLLAAAHETGLIDALEVALPEDLPADNGRRHYNDPDSRRALLLTLLFLPAVGLRRTHDLRGYTGDVLGLLTGRRRAYGYRHTERFLAAVTRAGGAEALTDALSRWTAELWPIRPRLLTDPLPAYYIDGHRKAVRSDQLIPRGLVFRYGKVLGCRALTLLHDEHGHPLLATTHRGDTHLTAGPPGLVQRYERAAGQQSLGRMVVDREGMAAGFLAGLAKDGRDAVTVLRGDQYRGESSFTGVGSSRHSPGTGTGESRGRWPRPATRFPCPTIRVNTSTCAWRWCAICAGGSRAPRRVVRRARGSSPTRTSPSGSTATGSPQQRLRSPPNPRSRPSSPRLMTSTPWSWRESMHTAGRPMRTSSATGCSR